MIDGGLDGSIAAALAAREADGLLRGRVVWETSGPVTVRRDSRTYLNFASNNYLGFTHHPRLLAVLHEQTAVGAGAAGLISGHTPQHARAEAAIAAWKKSEAALLMPSGYQANLAIVQTLAAIGRAGGGVRFLIDKLAHASLIDAVRQGGEAFRVFPHNGLAKLERLLADAPADQLQVILTESIFSMDGDAADLAGLATLKRRHSFVLVVDEAHGSGIYGDGGAGLVHETKTRAAVDIMLVTLSKALGLAGAAICGTAVFIRAVENFGRALIFSTAMSPLAAALAAEAVAICQTEPHHQARVRSLARRVRQRLADDGFVLPPGDSPILPIVLGDPVRAVAAAAALRDAGLLVVAVRPPTVAAGTSRLRVTLSAKHTDDQVDNLVNALKRIL